jgi:hypothetical protein
MLKGEDDSVSEDEATRAHEEEGKSWILTSESSVSKKAEWSDDRYHSRRQRSSRICGSCAGRRETGMQIGPPERSEQREKEIVSADLELGNEREAAKCRGSSL